MNLVMISSPPNYKKNSKASEWLPKSLDGTMHNDGQDSEQQKYMAFKVVSLKIYGFISALSCVCSRN